MFALAQNLQLRSHRSEGEARTALQQHYRVKPSFSATITCSGVLTPLYHEKVPQEKQCNNPSLKQTHILRTMLLIVSPPVSYSSLSRSPHNDTGAGAPKTGEARPNLTPPNTQPCTACLCINKNKQTMVSPVSIHNAKVTCKQQRRRSARDSVLGTLRLSDTSYSLRRGSLTPASPSSHRIKTSQSFAFSSWKNNKITKIKPHQS